LPLQKTINEENILRYNAMLIGVFDVLADARQQMAAVMAAIDAQRQFWLADAALRASLMGRPMDTALTAKASAGSTSAGGH
jgi:outer membrane protein TolC